MVLGSSPVVVTSPSDKAPASSKEFLDIQATIECGITPATSPWDMAPASSKEFLDIQATIECGFILKRVRDMTKTYSEMHRTDKYSEHSSIIWPVWPNG